MASLESSNVVTQWMLQDTVILILLIVAIFQLLFGVKSCIFSFNPALCMCPNSTAWSVDAEKPLEIFNCMVTVHVVKFCCGLFVNAGSTVCWCTCVWSTKISRVISVGHVIFHFSSLLHLIIVLLCVTSTTPRPNQTSLEFPEKCFRFCFSLSNYDRKCWPFAYVWQSVTGSKWTLGKYNVYPLKCWWD